MKKLLALLVLTTAGALGSTASAVPGKDFAHGVGEFGFLDVEQPGEFVFTAHSDADGANAKGHMTVRDLFGTGETVQARVECLAMDGQTAVIGAEPTKVPEFGAQSIFIIVLDNGDDDLVTAVATINPVDPDSCLSVLSFATPNVPVEGKVVVRDA
jgi:hypothetical protein